MKIGTIFVATDKLGRKYKYVLIGKNPSEPMREYRLWNIQTQNDVYVEWEWFNQRKIEVLDHLNYDETVKRFLVVRDSLLEESKGDSHSSNHKAYRLSFSKPLIFYGTRTFDEAIRTLKKEAGE